MTNAERITTLRNCSDGMCSLCPYDDHELSTKGCEAKLMRDAADALEATERLLDQNVKRCEALRKQLRESHESYEQRIADLEKQLPKEDEWKWNPFLNEYEWVDTTIYCPNCGAKMRGEQE